MLAPPYDVCLFNLISYAPLIEKYPQVINVAILEAPKGSGWTVWLSEAVRGQFLELKAKYMPKATHCQFVGALYLLYRIKTKSAKLDRPMHITTIRTTHNPSVSCVTSPRQGYAKMSFPDSSKHHGTRSLPASAATSPKLGNAVLQTPELWRLPDLYRSTPPSSAPTSPKLSNAQLSGWKFPDILSPPVSAATSPKLSNASLPALKLPMNLKYSQPSPPTSAATSPTTKSNPMSITSLLNLNKNM